VVSIQIDPDSGMPATPQCPKKINEVFISGTEPVGSCPLHGGGSDNTNVSGWDAPQPARPATAQPRAPSDSPGPTAVVGQPEHPPDPTDPEHKKKKGFFGRIFKRD